MPATAAQTRPELFLCPICINGEWRTSGGRTETLPNPATGEPITTVPYCLPEEVQMAVEAAARAFPSWREVPSGNRARILFRYREILENHREELAALVTMENGKTLEEARGSVQRGIEVVEFACGIPTLMMGETAENVARGVDGWTVRQPLGVCAGIPPFNFPAMVPLWMFPLALACGNTFVLKPSDKVPRTGTRLVELLYEAGLPAGVMNLVHGGKEVVDVLLRDPRVQAVSFVGSSPVAEYVYRTASAHGKRVQALGGAKNHAVVMPDCDLASTVRGLLGAAFGSAGERCLATSVVVAVGEIAEPLVRELIEAADSMKVGAGTTPGIDVGPVISQPHRERILQYVELAEREGAKLVRDGRQARPHDGTGGYYVGPTILDHVRPEMRIAQEEVFGPVLSVIRVRDLSGALTVINQSRYGNATAIYTRSGAAAREFYSRVEAGMVGVNVGVPAPMAFLPFTGWKGSFYGDLHAHGKDAVRFYTETKAIVARWPD